MSAQAKPISEERRQELRASFDLFDPQRTGAIEASRVGMVLRACGMQPTEARLAAIAKVATATGRNGNGNGNGDGSGNGNNNGHGGGKDGDGTVSFDDFVGIVDDLRATERPLLVEDVIAAFRVFDEAESGFVRVDDLRRVLTTMGERMSEDEFDQLIQLARVGENGLVDYRELAEKMTA